MTLKTQGVRELVERALGTLTQPYSEDIIDEVCFVIEHDSELHQQYQELAADLRAWVVNNWIGQYTKELTGGETIREVTARKSSLIKGYTKLQF